MCFCTFETVKKNAYLVLEKLWGMMFVHCAPTQCSKIRKKVQFQKYKNTFFAISKMAKINFCTRKKFKTIKNPVFFQSENCIFGSIKLFSAAKIDFLPFLGMQIMCFCTFEIALFFQF